MFILYDYLSILMFRIIPTLLFFFSVPYIPSIELSIQPSSFLALYFLWSTLVFWHLLIPPFLVFASSKPPILFLCQEPYIYIFDDIPRPSSIVWLIPRVVPSTDLSLLYGTSIIVGLNLINDDFVKTIFGARNCYGCSK